MSEYTFRDIRFSEPDALSDGRWLWIWNADKVPPHIGISENDRYFSLTFRECERAIAVSKKIAQAKRAGTPLVLVKLNNEMNYNDFSTVFSSYTSAVENQTTCLKPVLEALSVPQEIPQLSALLKLLESTGNLQEVFALNLAPGYTGIPAYSVTDIVRRIEELHETDRRKY